ncbi:MAG: glycosyltransferase [Planctomycetes bacterium]|nr:glycosyltransferase [Planctomycetota bacterium]
MARITAVIPALDEEESIGDVVRALLNGGIGHVVVADNGSRDHTAAVAAAAGAHVTYEPRRGYGSACLAALAAVPVEAAAVVFCDADGADDLDRLTALIAPVLSGQADLVIGSRVLGGAEPGALSPPQRAGNIVAACLLRLLYRARVTDLGPFRCVSATALRRLRMRDRAFGWTTEMQAKAYRLGLRVREVPVRARRRRGGQSKISGTLLGVCRAGCGILGTVVRCRVERLERRPV